METLRIKKPEIYVCINGQCLKYTRIEDGECKKCITKKSLDTRVREEVSATALARQSEFCHSTPLRRHLCG